MSRFKCKQCDEIVLQREILEAPNPFDDHDILHGCPECRSVDSFQLVCETDGCKQIAECGVNTQDGYKCLCAQHYRKEADK